MQYNAVLDNLKVYEAGKPIELVVREFGIEPDQIVKLASNENPKGCSPKVTEAVAANLNKMALYPDDSFFQLKGALAEKYGVLPENIVIGAGSDQVLEFACHAVLNEGNAMLINKVTFAMYEIYARQCGAKIIRTDTVTHEIDALIELYDEHKPKLVFLCTPSNPAGDAMDAADVYRFLEHADPETMVVVDAAYMEYAAAKDPTKRVDPAELIAKHPNALFTGTFSKAYGLGGMRVGYGIGPKEMIQAFHKLRPPFNITTLSAAAALAALEDQAFVDETVRLCFDEMKRYEAFAKERGLETIDSYTNFITLYMGERSSKEVADALLKKGMIVRDLTSYEMNAIRVTIGTPAQNDRFFRVFDEVTAD